MASRKQNPKTEDPGGYGKCLVRVSESDKEPKLSREARRRWGGARGCVRACAGMQAGEPANEQTTKQRKQARWQKGRPKSRPATRIPGYRPPHGKGAARSKAQSPSLEREMTPRQHL